MPKPDPALLDTGRYPYSCSLEPRFGDLDPNMHLNNVAQARLLEEGRVRFHFASGYRKALTGMDSMVASLTIEYLGQAHYPAPLDIHVGINAIGRASHTLSELVLQKGNLVAYAQVVLVCMGSDGPAALPAAFVEAAQPWMLKA